MTGTFFRKSDMTEKVTGTFFVRNEQQEDFWEIKKYLSLYLCHFYYGKKKDLPYRR